MRSRGGGCHELPWHSVLIRNGALVVEVAASFPRAVPCRGTWGCCELSQGSAVTPNPHPQVHYVAVAALVWMFSRYDLPARLRLPLAALLGLSLYKAFLLE